MREIQEVSEAPFDLELLKEKIREQVRSRKNVGLLRAFETAPARSPVDLSANGAALESALGSARTHWNVGEHLPTMGRRSGATRTLFQSMGRVVLRVGQLVTREQRGFNHWALEAMGAMYQYVQTQSGKVATVLDEMQQEADANQLDQAFARAQLDARVGRLETEQAARWAALTAEVSAARERSASEAHAWDRPGTDLETHLRGPPDEIRRRSREHVPAIVEAGAGTAERPLLDLGCGHGELLKVLREDGLVGRGIDSNAFAVTAAREAGLEVVETDVLEALQKTPDASVGAVTAIHVAEHLPLHVLMQTLEGIARVLQPGGIVVLETPNPENVIVGSCNFYVDPTHQRPLHPETLRLLVEATGFVRVRVVRLHPFPPEFLLQEDSPAARFLNERFFGPQDFAVIGYRALPTMEKQ